MNRILKAKIIEIYRTQADFAAAIKVNESAVSRVVRGRRNLDSDSQKEWAQALGCKEGELFGNQKVKLRRS